VTDEQLNSRRELLRKGGGLVLFGALSSVLAQGVVVAQAQDALEAAPAKEKPKLTKRLLIENRTLQRELDVLRNRYAELKRAFGDLSLLWESRGAAWRGIAPANLEGMLDLLTPWCQAQGWTVSKRERVLAPDMTVHMLIQAVAGAQIQDGDLLEVNPDVQGRALYRRARKGHVVVAKVEVGEGGAQQGEAFLARQVEPYRLR
jgi:hypothetical protein